MSIYVVITLAQIPTPGFKQCTCLYAFVPWHMVLKYHLGNKNGKWAPDYTQLQYCIISNWIKIEQKMCLVLSTSMKIMKNGTTSFFKAQSYFIQLSNVLKIVLKYICSNQCFWWYKSFNVSFCRTQWNKTLKS